MTKGKKGFQPGNPGGPGKPRLDPYLVEVKKMNRDEVERLMADLLKGDRAKLKAIIEDPTTPMLRLMVASLIQKAITAGDPSILNFLLDRTIGKVKETLEVDMTLKHEELRHDAMLSVVPHDKILELIRVKPE